MTDAALLPPLLGRAPAFLELLERVSRAAALDRPILVIGERGTGKELIAARLHFLSPRWDRTLVKLNCAALPESVLESELFGHEAGAFTGATRRRAGRFEMADRGTLFLDEIANASLTVQEKILRAVEYGEFERVGGSATIEVDVRLVAATNIDLPAAADAGDFRHDLLDRLSFDVLTVPPLRARREDITLLAENFAHSMAIELGWDAFPGFTAAARERLLDHAWPGNVRELKNTVERAVYRAEGGQQIDTIEFDPFASPFRPASMAKPAAVASPVTPSASPAEPFDLRAELAAHEVMLLRGALDANRQNQRATARWLGLTYNQLRHSLRKHGLLDQAANRADSGVSGARTRSAR